MKPPEWHTTFFDKAANDFWNAAVPAEHTAAEVAFLVDVLELDRTSSVLDLPAGRGRLAVPLAERVAQVVAADSSVDGVEHVRGKKPNIAAVRCDMRDIPLAASTFDGCYCMGNSFGYFAVPGVERWLAEIARVLRPGGRFVLESASVADGLLSDLATENTHAYGGVTIHMTHTYEPENERLVTDMAFDTDVQGTVRRTHQLILTVDRIAQLVEASGLAVTGRYGATDRTPYEPDAHSLLVAARKPG
jgi:ubiquinone/menaquinone biosynthesis C-methylase UbiE